MDQSTKNPVIVLLLIIAAGVGYLAYSEYQKRQFVANIAEHFGDPRGLETPERTKNMIAESLGLMGGIKAAVAEHYENTGLFPTSLLDVGYPTHPMPLPSHIEDIVIAGNGEILTTFDILQLGLSGVIEVATLRMTPEPRDNGGLNWTCSANPQLSMHPELLIAACRP